MSDETTFCPDCAIERGGWSSSTEKCQHHKTVDVISTLTKDLATSRRACEESGLAYETLAEEHARSENLAFHYAKEARELEAERDALRLALETATRERDDIAAWAESWMKRVAAAGRERDEARAALEKSRRTVYFTWRDVEACREGLSISADIKGDTLEEVVAHHVDQVECWQDADEPDHVEYHRERAEFDRAALAKGEDRE